jgi:hypothetical protein
VCAVARWRDERGPDPAASSAASRRHSPDRAAAEPVGDARPTGPADDSDIVAIGADLEPGTLLAAYRSGLFPMPFDRRRIAWFSPDPRGILPLDGLRVHARCAAACAGSRSGSTPRSAR